MDTYAYQLTIFMGYGIWNQHLYGIYVCVSLPLDLADSLADMTT